MSATRSLRVVLDGRVVDPRFPGIGRYVVCLAAALAETGEVALTLLHRPHVAVDPELGARGVALHAVDAAPFSLAEQVRLPGLARRLRPDVWHAPYYVMPYRRLACATVVTLYDAAPLALPALWRAHRRLAFGLLHRLAIRAADRVITVSEWAGRDLARRFGIAAERLTVTPLAAAPRFRPQPLGETARVRQSYALPSRFVLAVASDRPSKNLARLAAAFERLAAGSAALGYGCVVAGARSAAAAGQERRARMGPPAGPSVVRFLGIVPDGDLPALYAAADLFVSPSLHEGFGLPVLEAMACGTPVAVSRVASHPEVAGDAAAYFDPADVGAIAATIQNLMGDPARRAALARHGLERAAAHDWRGVARRTLAAYRAARDR